ncbi:MAG: hypothetical protein OEL55_06865, partial [Desulfobulbaceae bacterium]|nr:hypothetical protein [Desulfobulbaceae bacterium]
MRIPGRKTSLYILLVAVAVLAAIVFIAPRLLDVKAIKGTVAAHLRHDLHGEVAIGAIQLLWLPTPHVHVRDLSIDNDILKAKLPGVDLYPSWISLLPGITTSVKSVVLTQPQVVVKKIAAGKAMPKLPSLTVEIIDGSITTPGVDTGKAIDIPALSFSSVNASIDMDADSLALRINGSSSFVEKLSFTGKVNLSTLRYMADVDCQGLIVHKGSIVQGDAGKDFAAVDSVLNVKGSINGQGAYSFSSNIIGDM